jgi:RNA polymerase sigma factor (sigma-70 family)
MKNQVITHRTPNTNRLYNDLNKIERFDVEKENTLIREYKETGSIAARNAVISNNLLFAVSRAKVYTRQNNTVMSMTDLVSVATEGMIHALSIFDPSKGFKFISYAVIWIKQKVLSYIQNKSNTIRNHSHSSAVFTAIENLKKGGIDPTPENIFTHLHERTSYKKKFSVETIKDILDALYVKSTDTPLSYNDDRTILDTQLDYEYAADSLVYKDDLKKTLERFISMLNKNEAYCIRERYGLASGIPKTLQQIGEDLSLTREAVRHKLLVAERKLKRYMKKGLL